ncbi:MAG: fumarylacetoacetate hydrolase family protein [Planctomycetota bacterium]
MNGLICPLRDIMDETLADHWQNKQRWIKHNQELIDHLQQCGYDERDDNLPWQPRPRILLPPVGNPKKIICIGLNYRDHAIETGAEPPSLPIVFSKFNTALTGDHQPIKLPAISDQVDYEAELVVVIGKTARHVTADRVSDHIFGYTAGHDVSSRDWQKGRPGGQWLLAKSFDTFAPLGPCVVTQDALPDAGNLRIAMKLNDVVVQNSKTDQLIFDIPDLIVHLSQFMTLRPGDLIFTGTPPGVGAAATPPRYLKDGDTCQVMIEGIGCLTNHCATAH